MTSNFKRICFLGLRFILQISRRSLKLQFSFVSYICILFFQLLMIQIEPLDFLTKYALIIFNAITIIILYAVKQARQKHPEAKKNVLIVTAHPDDESMYFQPTIKTLSENYEIHLLCLSGSQIRKKELQQAAKCLKITKVECISHQHLVDGLKQKWDQSTIAELVIKYIHQNQIKAIFTFDKHGISGHQNHIAINSALKRLIVKQKPQLQTVENKNQDSSKAFKIKMYELTSVNLFRKYSSWVDIPISLLSSFVFINLNLIDAWKVMSKHSSQMLWYRKLWILFSRYTIINTYQQFSWFNCKAQIHQ